MEIFKGQNIIDFGKASSTGELCPAYLADLKCIIKSISIGYKINRRCKRNLSFSKSKSNPAGASTLKDINGNTLMDIKREEGASVYEQLKDKK